MSAVPSPQHQIDFLTKLQRLLGEGSFVSTYKYALLMALADLCLELGDDDDAPLRIDTRRIGEKFIEYYWRQSAPFMPASEVAGGVLRQNTGEAPKVIRLLEQQRSQFQGSLTGARQNLPSWSKLVGQVTAQVRKMPLWKLQTVGREKLGFLYGPSADGKAIELKAGVAYCFRRHHGLVADLVRGAWAQYVRRYNSEVFGAGVDLHEFLFGSERANLGTVMPILWEVQKGCCFYCGGAARRDSAHVDHFIPWARYPVDLGHNFVLVHGQPCNAKKSDRLACSEHLSAWVQRNRDFGTTLSEEFAQRRITHNLTASNRIVRWAYRLTEQCGGLTWRRADDLVPLDSEWEQLLAT